MTGMNAWAVGIIRFGAGMPDCIKGELKSIDITTRKLMTMNGVCLREEMMVDCILQEKKEEEGL